METPAIHKRLGASLPTWRLRCSEKNRKSAGLANNIIRDVQFAVAVLKSSGLMHNCIVRFFVEDFSSAAFTLLPEGDYDVLYNSLTMGDNYDLKLFMEGKHIAKIANEAIHYLFNAARFLKDSVETHNRGVVDFLNELLNSGYEEFEIPSWCDWHKYSVGEPNVHLEQHSQSATNKATTQSSTDLKSNPASLFSMGVRKKSAPDWSQLFMPSA
jgi:hypothetical protein